MKKQFLNLGKALNKAGQRLINGGNEVPVSGDEGCIPRYGLCHMHVDKRCCSGATCQYGAEGTSSPWGLCP